MSDTPETIVNPNSYRGQGADTEGKLNEKKFLIFSAALALLLSLLTISFIKSVNAPEYDETWAYSSLKLFSLDKPVFGNYDGDTFSKEIERHYKSCRKVNNNIIIGRLDQSYEQFILLYKGSSSQNKITSLFVDVQLFLLGMSFLFYVFCLIVKYHDSDYVHIVHTWNDVSNKLRYSSLLISVISSLYWVIPGILVSFGFLGTFVGLLYTLGNGSGSEILNALLNASFPVFSPSEADSQKVFVSCWSNELRYLLIPQAAGLQTAFATSVVGLALSVIVRVLHSLHDRYLPDNAYRDTQRRDRIAAAAKEIADALKGDSDVAALATTQTSRPTGEPEVQTENMTEIVNALRELNENIKKITVSDQVRVDPEINALIARLSEVSDKWRNYGLYMNEAARGLASQAEGSATRLATTARDLERSASGVRDALSAFGGRVQAASDSTQSLIETIQRTINDAKKI